MFFNRSPCWHVPIIHNSDCHIYINGIFRNDGVGIEDVTGLSISTPKHRDWIHDKDFMTERMKRKLRSELKNEGVILREWVEQFEKRLEENLWLWDPNDPKIKSNKTLLL